MRAVALNEYGGPEVLELMDLPDPKVGPDVVLVRTRAAGVNPVDYKMREGGIDGRFPSHFPLIPGWDLAGTVEEVGPDVREFRSGDEVIGYVRRDHVQWGTYAELVPAPLRTLAPKPASVGWAQAAALPLAGLTAWQALHRGLELEKGDVLLVHAAAGGVGSFAVQLARVLGAARVIGTASEGTHDYLRELGAEPVTYGEGLAERVRDLVPEGVTAVLDLVGGEALEVSPSLLAPGGRLASVRQADKVEELGGRYIFVRPDGAQLAELSGLVDAGRLAIHLHETFPMERAAAAQRLVEGGHVHGKVVLTFHGA
ncbi:MAG TPA: NADP-dependent oxidoreductase [Acidimicrobiales bacterium]|nr:NADP-dependent oxidoreductase [Acidimicrobiales bacterium]